ncbi:MurR/RpiR family transcriptional regulator [Parolsenella catena]|uniref:MurR/RpiR family transcriptional regulator n=1 Tax=Parolsenella catena TaxID=2003188 RepID=UPI002E79E9BA|nr:MurR/RpiR family transcriptional regulator [Parolsenella catena]
MDAFQQMSLHKAELTPTEIRVLDAVRDNPEAFLQSSTTVVAKSIGVSQSAVSRFCQKVGYDSFGGFQMGLMASLSANTSRNDNAEPSSPVDCLCKMVHATEEAVGASTFDALASRIIKARTVFTTGGGLSAPPALTLSLDLLKYNVPCFFMENGQEMIHMHVSGPEDLVIIFSSKNNTHQLFLDVMRDTPASRKPHLVMLSHSSTHPLRKLVDEFILLPTWQTERYSVYIEPMTSMLDFCSLLMVAVSQKAGGRPESLQTIKN